MCLSPEEEAFFCSELMNKSWALAKLLPSSPRSASVVVNETGVAVQRNVTHSGVYGPINNFKISLKCCGTLTPFL